MIRNTKAICMDSLKEPEIEATLEWFSHSNQKTTIQTMMGLLVIDVIISNSLLFEMYKMVQINIYMTLLCNLCRLAICAIYIYLTMIEQKMFQVHYTFVRNIDMSKENEITNMATYYETLHIKLYKLYHYVLLWTNIGIVIGLALYVLYVRKTYISLIIAPTLIVTTMCYSILNEKPVEVCEAIEHHIYYKAITWVDAIVGHFVKRIGIAIIHVCIIAEFCSGSVIILMILQYCLTNYTLVTSIVLSLLFCVGKILYQRTQQNDNAV